MRDLIGRYEQVRDPIGRYEQVRDLIGSSRLSALVLRKAREIAGLKEKFGLVSL